MSARQPSDAAKPSRDTHRSGAGRGVALKVLLEPVVAAAGYDLEEVTVSAAGRRSQVRVVIDSDTGIDLDQVAVVARAVSDVLDVDGEQILPGAYVLEVSSPGVDRRLIEPRHWRRAVGRLVATSVDGVQLRGRISSVDADVVTFQVDGAAVQASLSQLAPGRIEVEFSRPGQPEAWDEADDDDLSEDDVSEDDVSEDDVDLTDYEGAEQPQYGEV